MSARNWTPGPWDIVADPHGPPRVYRGRSGGFCVLGADPKRAIADARLIAAAPALYEALAATPCTCTAVAGASHGGQTEQLLDEQCARCAALALADGEQS